MADLSYHRHLPAVLEEDLRYVLAKDKQYAGSWARRGGVGAFMMLARKWDRLEEFMKAVHYDIFVGVKYQKGDGQGADGTVLAEVRDLRRYLLLVEAKMIEEGAVELPPSAQETMQREVLLHTGESRPAVPRRAPSVVHTEGLYAKPPNHTYQPGTPEDGGQHASAGGDPAPGDSPAESPETQPVPLVRAGALEDDLEPELQLASDRQPIEATHNEYRAVENLVIRHGSRRGYNWGELYAPPGQLGDRWTMHPSYHEEYGR